MAPCNCGKNKVRPLGSSGSASGSTGGASGTTTNTTTLYSPGKRYSFGGAVYGSQLEADAAKRRAGQS